MKKKILALSLALALLAVMVPATAFASTLTKQNYVDLNFDSGDLTNAAEGGPAINWNHVKWSGMAFETEPLRNNTSLRMVNNHSAEGTFNGRAVTSSAVSLTENDVIWYEFSFMQQNAPVGIRLQNGLSGLSLEPNGAVKLGHLATLYPTTQINTLEFGLNYWHHITLAIDHLDRENDTNGSAPKMYLWVNGVLVDNGKGYTALQDSRSITHGIGEQTVQFIILANLADTSNSGTVYVDNVKFYTTNQAVKNEDGILNYYDPEAIFGSAYLDSAAYPMDGSTVYVPESATLGDVLDSDLTYEGTLTYLDGEEEITDMSHPAVGVTLYVPAEDSLIGRTYHLVSNKAKNAYFDINFDDGTTTNTAGKLTLGYAGSTPTATFGVAADSIRGNRALKLDYASAGKAYVQGSRNISPAVNLKDKAMWYELSFMAEDSFPEFRISSQACAFHVFADGSISTGGVAGVGALPANKVADPKNPAQDFTFNLGEWYHLVVAIDNIDQVNGASKLYTWINGELMHDSTTLAESYTGLSSLHLQNARLSTNEMYIWSQSSAKSTLYLDNYKIYSTIASVADYDYNAAGIYADAAEPGSAYMTVDGTVYAPAGTTPADVKNSFVGGEVIESGNALYALTADKAYAKKYTLAALDGEYLFAPGTVQLERENGTKLLASAIKTGTKLRLSGVLANFTDNPKSGVLVLAAYNDGKLTDCVLTPVTAGGKVTTDLLTVASAENLTIRAFMWDSVSGLRPAMSAIY